MRKRSNSRVSTYGAVLAAVLLVLAAAIGGVGAAMAGDARTGDAGTGDPSKDKLNWISFEPVGEPFLHALFMRRDEIEIVEPELETGEMLEYLPAGAKTPIDWRELYFVKRAMPRAEILDHLAHKRWDALFDPGNRPSDLDDAPGLVVTDPRWTAINRRCPGILLVETKIGGRSLKSGINTVDGKLRMAPSLLRLYRVDLDKDGVLEEVIIKGYEYVYALSIGKVKIGIRRKIKSCKILDKFSIHFNGRADFFIIDDIYYMSNEHPSYYSNRILKFSKSPTGQTRERAIGDIYGVLTIKEFMERNLFVNPYYFKRLTGEEKKSLERKRR